MLKPGRNKEGQVEGDLNLNAQKVDNLRVPVEMWDRRSW